MISIIRLAYYLLTAGFWEATRVQDLSAGSGTPNQQTERGYHSIRYIRIGKRMNVYGYTMDRDSNPRSPTYHT